MKKSNTLRYLLVALIAAACGVGGTCTVNHLRQQMEYVKVILPQPEIPTSEQPANDITLADLINAMKSVKPYTWSYSGHHSISRLANGPYFTADEADMCTEQEIRDATRAAIQIYIEDYHNLELAWWQSRSPLRRTIILALFYSAMSPEICCFPNFSCQSFAPEIAAQRRKEIEWVAAHRAELYEVLSPLIEEHRKKRKKHE